MEQHPESVTLSRVINDTGSIASQTNGRGYTRGFTYDGMNRLTGITYPRNAPVSIAWDTSGKTLTRGNYQERVEFDGFGRPIRTTRRDLVLGTEITQTQQYDVHGNTIFASYPNSDTGVSSNFDILKRLTEVTHPDGSRRSYVHASPRITETDERGNSTAYVYRAYGAPDKDKVLVQTSTPHNVYTLLYYDRLNHVTKVFQGRSRRMGISMGTPASSTMTPGSI